ncbi:MAG TPA: TIGR03086 family metal-binding protein [Acidimicrobiales bacterium]|jgi:uncharacterized protein (TIGR03086 family)|nr:TIGR03086 family metal-binding protein [Acidimicrobiales bacterium]
MSEVSERYGVVGDQFSCHVGGVPPQSWTAPSPCLDWTAEDVVIHVVNTHRRVLASLDQSEPEVAEQGEDLGASWAAATQAVRSALADPAQATRTIAGMFGEQPFESLVGRLLCTDTLIHTWDLARATGQDESLDPESVAKAVEFLTPIDEAIRRPGGFGPRIEPSPEADEQTRLLNFAGRTV